MLTLLPLAAAATLAALLAGTAVSRRLRLLFTRVALAAFGDYVADRSRHTRDQQRLLRAAHHDGTHRVYAARTLLYAALSGVVGSVLGVYLVAGALRALDVSPAALRASLPAALGFLSPLARLTEATVGELFALVLVSSATVGAALALGTYSLRWRVVGRRAAARATAIDATLPRTVAFVYALSRSGMAFPKVLDTLEDNRAVYGEAARELGVAVRDMETFGTDVLTALRRTGRRTPSEDLGEFSENLASVLASGRSLSTFLRDQYDRYQEEAESQQEQYLDLLATFAEAYVTVLVAGPLFFITVLVVIGLVLEETVPLLRIVVYAGLPLASAGFVLYVDSVTEAIRAPGDDPSAARPEPSDVGTGPAPDPSGAGASTAADGGAVADRWAVQRERLAAYERLAGLLDRVTRPVETVLGRPSLTFAATVPAGLGWVYLRSAPVPTDGLLAVVEAVDAAVVQAAVVALAAYAVVYETEKRRVRTVERSVPDFLDRLASVNEAGLTVVESVRRVSETDLDALTPELERTWRDVQWGADVETALYRLDERVDSPLISRSVALVTNAARASGDVAPVLSIAADEAQATRRLRRERRQTMLTYLIVIYVSFLVFLGIAAALTVSFMPAVEAAETGGGTVPTGVSGGITEGLAEVDVAAYETLMFHASAVQAVCSGLVAGQLGEGTVRDGAKHAAVLLALAFVAFTLM